MRYHLTVYVLLAHQVGWYGYSAAWVLLWTVVHFSARERLRGALEKLVGERGAASVAGGGVEEKRKKRAEEEEKGRQQRVAMRRAALVLGGAGDDRRDGDAGEEHQAHREETRFLGSRREGCALLPA